MLFSRKEIAEVINSHFEPVWKMVRPVPIIRIDFGNGKKLTRTLHGNIATYVCLEDGTVVDVLPGVYDPVSYREQLLALKTVAERVSRGAPRPEASLALYHRLQEHRLLTGEEAATRREAVKPEARLDVTKARIERPTELALDRPAPLVKPRPELRPVDVSKSLIERPTELALDQPVPVVKPRPAARRLDVTKARIEIPTELVIEPAKVKDLAVRATATSSELVDNELADWRTLREDTRHNELIRRKLIHGYLKDKPGVKPDEITKWLYREVLNTDLDDPYLGLAHTLFGNYPFSKEDGSN